MYIHIFSYILHTITIYMFVQHIDISFLSFVVTANISNYHHTYDICLVNHHHFLQMEMRSNQLLKDHELRRRDLMILRFDRQRALCDEIISRQRDVIQGQWRHPSSANEKRNGIPILRCNVGMHSATVCMRMFLSAKTN